MIAACRVCALVAALNQYLVHILNRALQITDVSLDKILDRKNIEQFVLINNEQMPEILLVHHR